MTTFVARDEVRLKKRSLAEFSVCKLQVRDSPILESAKLPTFARAPSSETGLKCLTCLGFAQS